MLVKTCFREKIINKVKSSSKLKQEDLFVIVYTAYSIRDGIVGWGQYGVNRKGERTNERVTLERMDLQVVVQLKACILIIHFTKILDSNP